MANSAFVLEVGEEDFAAQVLERSKETPIVVDFWAPWCGPCRTLGPLLESEAARHKGKVLLAKLNVDDAPSLAAQFRIQGIPAVKAFRGGKVVAEFVGAVPAREVRAFFEKLLPGLSEQQPGEELLPARGLAEQGRLAEASALLEKLPPEQASRPEAVRLRAGLKLRLRASEASSAPDPAAGVLGSDYAEALALALAERYPEALDRLVEIVRRDRAWNDGAARKAMLEIFEIVGVRSELAEDYRHRLATILF